MYKNSEGYNDPTAGEAMGKLTGKEKKARSDRRKAQRKRTARLVDGIHGSIRISRSAIKRRRMNDPI